MRRLWATEKSCRLPLEELSDIFYIEALGPAMVMHQWPKAVSGRPWVHFIDNAGAQRCIVRGSPRADCGDVVVNFTWRLASELRIFLWLDRVSSKSNPVDGLSRKRFAGPWKNVQRMQSLQELRYEIEQSLSMGPGRVGRRKGLGYQENSELAAARSQAGPI